MPNFPFIPPSSFPVTKAQYLPCELMPTTMIGERPGSGNLTFGQNGVTGTREWVVPWVDPSGRTYLDYISQLIGLSAAGPNGVPAITYPDVFSAELPWLFCQEVDMKGEDCIGVDAWGRIRYRRALLTAKYKAYESGETFHVAAQSLSMLEGSYAYVGPFSIPKPPPYRALIPVSTEDNDNDIADEIRTYYDLIAAPDVTDDEKSQYEAKVKVLLSEMSRGRTNPSTPDPEWVKSYNQWLAGAVGQCANPGCDDEFFQANKSGSVAQPLTKVIPLGEYSLERHMVLSPDFWTYITLLGTVNAFFFLGFPPWTAMFSGVEGKRGTLPNGSRIWNLTLKFHFNPNSWNHVYRPDKGQWEAVASVKKGTATYWSSDAPVPKSSGSMLDNTYDPNSANNNTKVNFTPTEGELHNWLYRPADFSPLLFFS